MRKYHSLKKSLLLSAALVLVQAIAPSNSYAQDKLTKQSIEAFYAKATQVQLAGEEQTMAFLETFMHDDLEITMHMISNIKNMSPHKKTVIYNKADIIKNTRLGYQNGSISKIESNVLAIDIAKDGLSAKVKDSTYSLFKMTRVLDKGGVVFDNEQSMLCDAILVLNQNGKIQSKGGECNVEVVMIPVE